MPLKVMVFNVAVTYMPEGHIYADTDEGITDADVFVTTADLPPWAQPQQRTDVTERSSERVAGGGPSDLLERAERLAARLQREAEGERVTASSVLRRALRRGIDELEREAKGR